MAEVGAGVQKPGMAAKNKLASTMAGAAGIGGARAKRRRARRRVGWVEPCSSPRTPTKSPWGPVGAIAGDGPADPREHVPPAGLEEDPRQLPPRRRARALIRTSDNADYVRVSAFVAASRT